MIPLSLPSNSSIIMFFWGLAKWVCQITYKIATSKTHNDDKRESRLYKPWGSEFMLRQHTLKLRRKRSVGLHVVYNLSLSSLIME